MTRPGRAPVLVDHDRLVQLGGLHLAHHLRDALGLGHEMGLPHDLRDGHVGVAFSFRLHQVLAEHQAQDVVDALPEDRYPAEAGGDGDLDDVGHLGGGFHDDHVRPGHHDLTDDRVAEVDDGMDEAPFLALDDRVLGGGVGHGQQLLLRHVGTLLDALAGQDDVGQADEGVADPADGRDLDQGGDEGGGDEGRLLGVLHRPRLGHGLGEDEDEDDFEGGGGGDTERAEEVGGNDADQRRGHGVAEEQEEQHRVQRALGVLDQLEQGHRAPLLLILEGHGFHAVHAGQPGFGQGENPGHDDECRHRDQEP